jgi:hypothetical protein
MKICQITTSLAVTAVIAGSLLAAGIVTAVSITEEADATVEEDFRNTGQCMKVYGPEFKDDCLSFHPDPRGP